LLILEKKGQLVWIMGKGDKENKENRELTAMERLFCYEYVADANFNAEKAAIKAGYAKGTARTKAYQWVSKSEHNTKPHLITFINKLLAKREAKIEKNGEWVIQKLTEVAERCLQEVAPEVNKKGERVYTEDKEGRLVAAYVFNANGANKSLELLGKHFNQFSDNLNIRDLTFEDILLNRRKKQ
jgi:phage terminase small subunit